MTETDPRPSARRLYVADFVAKAVELGYEDSSARQAWRTIVQAVKKAVYSVLAASDEYVTRGQLAELLKGGPGQVSQEKWRLITKVGGRLLRTVSRDELYRFGTEVGAAKTVAGHAWNMFLRNESQQGGLGGALTTDEVDLKHLEAFCNRMEDEDNWPLNYGPVHDSLLRAWLVIIKQ